MGLSRWGQACFCRDQVNVLVVEWCGLVLLAELRYKSDRSLSD